MNRGHPTKIPTDMNSEHLQVLHGKVFMAIAEFFYQNSSQNECSCA